MTDLQWAALVWAAAVVLVALVAVRMRGRRRGIDRSVGVLSALVAVAFLALSVQAARVQVFQGAEMAGRTGVDPSSGESLGNSRGALTDLEQRRGPIVDRNGVVLAESQPVGTRWKRVYGDTGITGPVGYFSPLLYGRSGLEAAYDDALSGEVSASVSDALQRLLLGNRSDGFRLVLTVDSGLQAMAQQALGDSVGAAVVVDVQTGQVLALASSPTFDPNRLTTWDAESVDSARDYWSRLLLEEDRPLVVRSTDGLYTPGSTFKLVTAAAAIDTGLADAGTLYVDDGALLVDGRIIEEANRPDDTVTEWTLEDGVAYSLNVVLAQVGLQLGPDVLASYAAAFGIGEELPFELPVQPGQIAGSESFLDQPVALAETSFGQGELLVTPLHMALVAAAIANDGLIMQPYLVERIETADGEIVKDAAAEEWRRPISAATAAVMQDIMVAAVERGSAGRAAVAGAVIGGKTGTAETAQDAPHAWFIGFGGDPEPRYAVAVVLEHGGSGTGRPAEIAGTLLATALALET